MEHAEAHAAGSHTSEMFERARMGMWFFLASEIMMFGAFIGVYIVLRMSMPDNVVQYSKDLLSWKIACLNTAILILSSYTMVRGVNAISKDDRAACNKWLIITALLGLAFMVVKGYEYSTKFSHGIYPNHNVFFGCYFLMTGFHGFHVLVGILILLALPFFMKHFSSQRYAYVENTGLYWHFVDLVWIFLFPIVYLL